jgi:hypothetical protein
MFPDPPVAQLPPPDPLQVQVAPVVPAGRESVTMAPVTEDGPPFEATIVYVMGVAG